MVLLIRWGLLFAALGIVAAGPIHPRGGDNQSGNQGGNNDGGNNGGGNNGGGNNGGNPGGNSTHWGYIPGSWGGNPNLVNPDRLWDDCYAYDPQGCLYKNEGSKGVVVSPSGSCSAVGVEILKLGGSAADAAIATGLCVGVVAPHLSGLGGGGTSLVKTADTAGFTPYGFIVRAPDALTPEMLADRSKATTGGLSVGKPAELAGWVALHERFGFLKWDLLVDAAMMIAFGGFRVDRGLAAALEVGKDFILKDEMWSSVFAPNGTLLKEGDWCIRQSYGNLLSRIKGEGPNGFYRDRVRRDTLNTINSTGGVFTEEELKNAPGYQLDPGGSISFRGYKVYSTGIPTSGTLALHALKIYEGWTPEGSDMVGADQLLIESTRFAYAKRTAYGDPVGIDRDTFGIREEQERFLTEAGVADTRGRITPRVTHPIDYYNAPYTAPPAQGQKGVVSTITVRDTKGMAVSVATSIGTLWGSQLMTPWGLILNNAMADFSTPGAGNPNPLNLPIENKRPFSGLGAYGVEDANGNTVMLTGSTGIYAPVQVIRRYIETGFNSIGSPRWRDELTGITNFDKETYMGVTGYPDVFIKEFQDMGYNTTNEDGRTSVPANVLGVSREAPHAGLWVGFGDNREETAYGQAEP